MCMTLLSRGSTAGLAHLGQFNGGKTAEVCGISFKITDSTRTSATFMHRNFRGVPDEHAPRPLLCTETSEVYRMRAIAATHHFLIETVCRCFISHV